jgi:hypothetical protein
VAGKVNADGTVAAGTGFTVQKIVPGTGNYMMSFVPPMAVDAACAVGLFQSGDPNVSTTQAYVNTSRTVLQVITRQCYPGSEGWTCVNPDVAFQFVCVEVE